MKINSTIGNYLQGQSWKSKTKAQIELADNFDAVEAAEDVAEQNAGPGKCLGFMQQMAGIII